MNTADLRPDLKVMAEWIAPESRVLDVGCGDGELLHWLVQEKQADARGLEMEQASVAACIAKGLAVVQGNANTDLSYYPTQSFDYVVMSQTLQRMDRPDEELRELARIGKKVIVSLPNFAHWHNRLYLLLKGQMPMTSALSYPWYETPNIHFCSLTDFVALCAMCELKVQKQYAICRSGSVGAFSQGSWLANFRAAEGVFLLENK